MCKKHKACCKKYKALILKYVPCISKIYALYFSRKTASDYQQLIKVHFRGFLNGIFPVVGRSKKEIGRSQTCANARLRIFGNRVSLFQFCKCFGYALHSLAYAVFIGCIAHAEVSGSTESVSAHSSYVSFVE